MCLLGQVSSFVDCSLCHVLPAGDFFKKSRNPPSWNFTAQPRQSLQSRLANRQNEKDQAMESFPTQASPRTHLCLHYTLGLVRSLSGMKKKPKTKNLCYKQSTRPGGTPSNARGGQGLGGSCCFGKGRGKRWSLACPATTAVAAANQKA